MTKQSDDIILEEDDVNPPPAADEVLEVDDENELQAPAEAPPPWTCNPDGTRTLPLLTPITLKFKKRGSNVIEEKVIKELRFRRLSGGDMMAVQNLAGDDVAQNYAIFRMFTGEGNAVYDRLDQDDVVNVGDLVADFFPKSRKAGKRI